MRTRSPACRTLPSSTVVAPSRLPISFRVCCRCLNGMTEVREITWRARIFDRCAMTSSVIPSAKYSFSGSALRLRNGSTAMDRARGAPVRQLLRQRARRPGRGRGRGPRAGGRACSLACWMAPARSPAASSARISAWAYTPECGSAATRRRHVPTRPCTSPARSWRSASARSAPVYAWASSLRRSIEPVAELGRLPQDGIRPAAAPV